MHHAILGTATFAFTLNRAARLVDEMEHLGVVVPAHGSKPRELLRGLGA